MQYKPNQITNLIIEKMEMKLKMFQKYVYQTLQKCKLVRHKQKKCGKLKQDIRIDTLTD